MGAQPGAYGEGLHQSQIVPGQKYKILAAYAPDYALDVSRGKN